MRKGLCFILMTLLLLGYFISLSSADGGLFTQLYKDIIEPNQLAMMVFDEMVEKIIFQIDYQGNTKDFAWIIPVPAYPKLFYVEDDIFFELYKLTKSSSGFGCGWGIGQTDFDPNDEGIHIWEENQVGIYYTTTLTASDPHALLTWLNDNNYAFPAEGQEILDYYIQKEWFFIAMKIQFEEAEINIDDYSGAIQPIGVMFFSEEIIYPLKISALSAPSWGTEVLIYVFSEGRVTFSGAQEEYSATITPAQLKEYPILQNLIDETFTLTKLRKNFSSEEMAEDLILSLVQRNIKISSVFDLNSPLSQVILFISVFIFFLKKSRRS